MTSSTSNSLQFNSKLGCLLGSCCIINVSRWSHDEQSKHVAWECRGSTFEVLSLEKNRAYVILLNESPHLLSDRSAIKPHHEQLAELSGIYRSVVDCLAA